MLEPSSAQRRRRVASREGARGPLLRSPTAAKLIDISELDPQLPGHASLWISCDDFSRGPLPFLSLCPLPLARTSFIEIHFASVLIPIAAFPSPRRQANQRADPAPGIEPLALLSSSCIQPHLITLARR